jgi:hypothetical protein
MMKPANVVSSPMGMVPQLKFSLTGFSQIMYDGATVAQKCRKFHHPTREIVAGRKNESHQGKTKTLLSIKGNCPIEQLLQNSNGFTGLGDPFPDSTRVTFVQTQYSTHSWHTTAEKLEQADADYSY